MRGLIKKKKLISFLIYSLVLNLPISQLVLPTASKAVAELCRNPLDVMITMDTSGSMGYDDPTRISQAILSANGFVDKLDGNDQSGLVSFDTSATLDKQLSSDHAATKTAINGLVADGSTDTGDAIKMAADELKSIRANAQATKIMILMTDGMANRPNGPGYGEYPADVQYAIDEATIAGAAGIKIFTIGIGSGVSTTMLTTIATLTGGTYYSVADGTGLNEVFNAIGYKACEYGSISGCKYNDVNHDGTINPGEPTVSGWKINLSGTATDSQLTDANGCYSFSGLKVGSYTVSEDSVQSKPFTQIFPVSPYNYSLTVGASENVTGKDFGNYFPSCGNTFVDEGEQCEGSATTACTIGGYNGLRSCNADTCLWSDTCVPQESCGDGILNDSEQCDGGTGVNGTVCTPAYGGSCNYCDSTCHTQTVTGPSCGDGVKNGSEQCDGTDGTFGPHQSCNADCQILTEAYCGDSIKNGTEACDGKDGITGVHDYCTPDCTIGTLPYCGDGVVNGDEQCDGTAGLTTGQTCSETCAIVNPPTPDTSVLIICKYADGDADIETTDDRTALADWAFTIRDEEMQRYASATTTETGCVTVTSLVPGYYRVAEAKTEGWEFLSPRWGYTNVSLEANATTTLNFYNYRLGGLSGNVYQDADGNVGTTGDRSALPTWLVTLYSGEQTIATTTSDSSGYYSFLNLAPGTYYVTETLQSGWNKLAEPSNPIVVLSGVHSGNNNFVNAVPVTPPPVCTGNCGGGGGGGGMVYAPRIVVVKKANKTEVKAGEQNIPYEFTISNQGTSPAQNVKAVDTLPAGFVFPDTGLATRTWDVGTLNAGEIKTFNYFVNALTSTTAGIHTNKVVVTSLSGDPAISTSDVSVIKPAGQVLGVKVVKFQNTGFDTGEFGVLVTLTVLFGGAAWYLKRKSETAQ